MNTKDFLRLGVPLGEATRPATDFVACFAWFRQRCSSMALSGVAF
jgi:hypothetical protein